MARLSAALLLVLVAGCSGGSSPPPAPPPVSPPTIVDVSVFLAAWHCQNGAPAVFVSGCGEAPQTAAEPMLWRRFDWAHADGAQIEDAYQSGAGYVNTFSYPPHGPFVASNGDGGDLLVSDGHTVRIDFTQNGDGHGGTVSGYWVGPKCGGTGWLLFDNEAPTGSWRSTVATLKGSTDPNACPSLNTAYTQWRLETAAVPVLMNGAQISVTMPIVISEHYDGPFSGLAGGMERFIQGEHIGRVVWEAWSRSSGPSFASNCPGIAGWSDPPGPGWRLIDRRCLTDFRQTDGAMTGAGYGWP